MDGAFEKASYLLAERHGQYGASRNLFDNTHVQCLVYRGLVQVLIRIIHLDVLRRLFRGDLWE
ncbi:hypothetical protein A5708_24765 [Mycobacterium colombiense]|uniref:Uncharacterized protein n=1 Tax=Mycobacterium colombiense TaxID=339268 RepID=A0A1A2YSA5_9MYCO|nr:hypothetical protein A5708_24765 [Mycobacterium colombiense]